MACFKEAVKGALPAETVIIGHGIDAPLAIRIAAHSQDKFNTIFLIAPFAKQLGIEGYDELNQSFVASPFGAAGAIKGCK